MQIGKYSFEQLVKVSMQDSRKIKFGFWGGAVSILVYLLFKGLASGAMPNCPLSSLLDLTGNILFGLLVSITIIGLTFAVRDSFGGSKKANTSLWKLGVSKLLPFLGVLFLYALTLTAVFLVEYGLLQLGGVPTWGPLMLGVLAFPLIIFNLLVIVIIVVGTKLLTAGLVLEKGNIWELFLTLNNKIFRNLINVLSNVAWLVLTSGLLGGVAFILLSLSFRSVMFLDRMVFQQLFLSGGMIEWPLVAFSTLTEIAVYAAGLWAAVYIVSYSLTGLYSIYLGLGKK
jgi:hypothetical protein